MENETIPYVEKEDPPVSISRLLAAYRRPQALLFLLISYALWASVALRWILEFVEQGLAQTPLLAALLLLFGLLLGLEPLLTQRSPRLAHPYLAVQLAIVLGAVLFFYEMDFFALLFVPLAGQAVYILAPRPASTWVAVLMLANVAGQLQQFGWPRALPFVFLYSAAILFVAAFSQMTLRADTARRRSDALLAELQDAHSQLQTYAGQAEELAVAQERNRLARELHDSVAQTLYGIVLQAEAAGRKLEAGRLTDVGADLGFLQESAQQSLRETRLLIFALRPPILDEVGLSGALRTRLDAVERRSGLECHLYIGTVDPLPPLLETAYYRIAQEALNNVLKHARATEVTVKLQQQNGCIRLEVCDDGVGFDPGGPSPGFGLQNMRDRAAKVGGVLKLASQPGQGACVTVETPL